MFDWMKRRKAEPAPSGHVPLRFKTSTAAFEYACEYLVSDLKEGVVVPALVLDASDVFEGVSAVGDLPDGGQVAALRVSGKDGGFVHLSATANPAQLRLRPGDLVAWQVMDFKAHLIRSTDKPGRDGRTQWQGLIVAKLLPEFHVTRGWVIEYPFLLNARSHALNTSAEAVSATQASADPAAPTATDLTPAQLGLYLSSASAEGKRYKAEALVRGIAHERARFAGKPFLLVVNQQCFDYDGMTDTVFLLDAYATEAEGVRVTEGQYASSLRRQTEQRGNAKLWKLESEGDAPYLPASAGAPKVRTVLTRSFKLRASGFETRYTTFRLCGPFLREPIDMPLADFVGARFELWSYFVQVGEAIQQGGTLPRPDA